MDENTDDKLSINYFHAASAGVAQSVALASQNAVDALHNQNVVRLTTLGSAYAKWLQNPQMATEFQTLADAVTLDQQKSVVVSGLQEFVETVMNPSDAP